MEALQITFLVSVDIQCEHDKPEVALWALVSLEAIGCQANSLFKKVKVFVLPTCLMILCPRTTTSVLVDTLIPNMGGPVRNKIPDDDSLNAALDLLSC